MTISDWHLHIDFLSALNLHVMHSCLSTVLAGHLNDISYGNNKYSVEMLYFYCKSIEARARQNQKKGRQTVSMIWNQHICVKYVTQKVLRNHTICNMRTFPIILYKIKIYNLWLIVLFCLHLCLHHILF